MLELAKFAVLAMATEMPVIAHLLARALHAFIKRSSGNRVAWRKWFVESHFVFVVISVLFLLVNLSAWRNGDAAVRGGTGFPDSSYYLLAFQTILWIAVGDGDVAYDTMRTEFQADVVTYPMNLHWLR